MEAKLEQQKKEKIIDLLDADVLTSKSDADWLKESLQEQLTPEISEYIDGKPTLEGITEDMADDIANMAEDYDTLAEMVTDLEIRVEKLEKQKLKASTSKKKPYLENIMVTKL